ncbi:hypothetical protein ACQEU5_15585 [Marinactinospora thermotolerans]|uniref:Uncharacterized protein n=1 Tax=Marinactinospora thermotolerans DSM 45154 TaxID=1122192 RepID=A0A1T4T900_9ACTN|nr:hypothetical protein [Marinactinospora thermotolerans]SKA36942.1 hypothetical protein SAMN02745673_04659 [Marinactinospora thermotolerans DSM 45154]
MSTPDDERPVGPFDDDFEVLPDVTADERGYGWGEPDHDNDARLLEERPPHWG